MLSRVIKNKIESQFGQQIRYPKDCESLAADITHKTKHHISGSTIKRLLGFVKGTKEPREYTLDVIAEYLGCLCYEDLIKQLDFNDHKQPKIIEEIIIKNLPAGQQIKLKFGIEEEVLLSSCDKNELKVIDASNCILLPGDRIILNKIIRCYPLYIKQIKRKDEIIDSCIIARLSGVKSIEIIKP